MKSAIGMNDSSSVIKKVIVNNVIIESDIGIANSMNKFFVDSIVEISSIDYCDSSVIHLVQSDSVFKFRLVEICDIDRIVSRFKYKIGGKKILSEGVVKDSMEYLGFFYTKIVNESMILGKVPECWKTSMIDPIEKVKNTCKAEEFRPINTLPCDEKIMESVIKEQLEQYLEENNIIIPQQSGFRRKHSCETALNLVLAEFKDDLSSKNTIISVFLDLKRAFETIDRNLLLKKLFAIGIKDIELEWFRSFLSDRKQRTIIGSAISEEVNVGIGLPQGSVLATILFNLY